MISVWLGTTAVVPVVRCCHGKAGFGGKVARRRVQSSTALFLSSLPCHHHEQLLKEGAGGYLSLDVGLDVETETRH